MVGNTGNADVVGGSARDELDQQLHQSEGRADHGRRLGRSWKTDLEKRHGIDVVFVYIHP
jgi:hypothetical protein